MLENHTSYLEILIKMCINSLQHCLLTNIKTKISFQCNQLVPALDKTKITCTPELWIKKLSNLKNLETKTTKYLIV